MQQKAMLKLAASVACLLSSVLAQSSPEATCAASAKVTCTYTWAAGQGETCHSLADGWGLSDSDFQALNPCTNCSAPTNPLVDGQQYCVEGTWATAPTSTSPGATTTTAPATGPSPTQSGIISSCTKYYKAVSGDSCSSIASKAGTFTVEDFEKWNPAVGTDCSGLWAGYYYCVAVPGTPTGKPATTTTAATGPSPTQSGIISSCTKYYKAVSGDSCSSIASKAGTFTVEDFEKWNPAVGTDCSGLWAGYYYCVAVPGTPTGKPTTTAPAGPSPTQSGIISSCTKYYKAVSGDSCSSIASKAGTFSVAEFEKWNPAVGSDCSGLWAGYYYCVAVPGTPTSKPTTTAPSGPQPEQSGITKNCKKYYKVVSGDTCDKIVKKYSITSAHFYSWNPAVGSSCKSLWVGYYVCVGV